MTDVTGHDPMALAGEPLPTPSPWESLARQARWLADYAERCAAAEPDALAPDDERDPLAELDERALGVRSIVAACRRHTYRQLREQGHSVEEIADAWRVTRAAVYKALNPGGGKGRP